MLLLLKSVPANVAVIIFSDNIRNILRLSELQTFQAEYPNVRLTFQKTGGKFHDRYIIIDYKCRTEKIYHCGASSKDAGNKITTIAQADNKKLYYPTEKELDIFIQMRITRLKEEGATENIDLVPGLRDYYDRHMADGTFVSWLALDGEKIIGTSGMSFVEKPPYFGCPSGRIGLLSSMFTDPDYRRMGIAKELLSRVAEEARAYGCGTVQITASDMGVKLYTAYGFTYNGNFMYYKL